MQVPVSLFGNVSRKNGSIILIIGMQLDFWEKEKARTLLWLDVVRLSQAHLKFARNY